MYSFAKYRDQYRSNLRLAAPVVLSQAGIILTQLVDTAMVGRVGTTALTGVSLGGTVFFFLFIFCMGLSMGITPLVGEMYARGSHRETGRYLQNSFVLYFIIGCAAVGVQMLAVPFMHLMNPDPAVVAQAIPYYKYLVWSMFPFMMYATFKQFLEGVGNTKITMISVLSSNVINVIFNWLFIYGNWGFPEMGAAGAGLATLIARLTCPVMMAIYFLSKERFRRYLKFFNPRAFKWEYMRNLLRVGFPIAVQMLLEGAAFALTTIMMGWIGTVQMGANKIAMDISNFAFMMVQGIAAATTIRISHEYGRRNLPQLRQAARASYHIGVAWNVFTAIVFIALREYIPRIFTSDPEVIRMASHLMVFVAVFQVSDGLQVITVGILRGIQDVKSIMKIALLSYIVISLPLGYLLAFPLRIGPGGLWIGIIFGLSTAAVLLIRRFRRQYALMEGHLFDE